MNMTKAPLFSVLIANYNNGSYIQETVNSILQQTYNNWEIVIVDDASTDNSLELYKLWKDNPQIKVFFNKCNQGVGYTKKRCVDEATGEICGFIDPDDAIVPHAIEVMVNAHLRHQKAGLIYSEAYYCDEKLNINTEASIQRHRSVEKESYLHEEEYIVGHFATFKRSKYLQSHGLNPSYKRAVDQDLYYILEEVSDLIYINQFLYLYRIHEKGVSSVGVNTTKAFSWHIAIIIDTCKRRNIAFEDIVSNKIKTHMIIPERVYSDKELNRIKNSYSFRIGRIVTRFLYPLKKFFK